MEYLAVSHGSTTNDGQQYRGMLVITAQHDNTNVEIFLPVSDGTMPSKVTQVIYDANYFYQLRSLSEQFDFTGAYVVADKPISLVSGHECVELLASRCDSLYISPPLISELGIDHIVPPLYGGREVYPGYLVKIISAYNDTEVNKTETSDLSHLATLNKCEFHEELITVIRDSVAIKCSKPCMVIQYNRGRYNSEYGSDAFVMYVADITSYVNTLVTLPTFHPNNRGYRVFISVVTNVTDTTNIIEKGGPPNGFSFSSWESMPAYPQFRYAGKKLTGTSDDKTYNMTTTETFTTIGIWLYAHHGMAGYGNMASFGLTKGKKKLLLLSISNLSLL